MPPDDRPPLAADRIRYQHMLEAAAKAIRLTQGRTADVLETDDTLALALTRLIEIIGEAAWQITDDGKALAPDLPWRQIIGMRHRIVHAYFDINYSILWKTIQESLPQLSSVVCRTLDQWDHPPKA